MKSKVNISKKKDRKKKYAILGTISLIIILTISILYKTHNYEPHSASSSYETSVKQYINEIIKENKKVSAYNKGQTINTENSEDIKKGLDANITTLTSLKNSIQNITPDHKNKSIHESLVKGLNNNILIYRQVASMLQNPNSRDIDKSVDSLENYRDEAMKNYELITAKDIKISLPKETENFINNSISYFTEAARINKNLEIQNAQNAEFIDGMDNVIKKFTPIKTEFSYQLMKVRAGSGSYDDVLSSISQYKDRYLSVKKDFRAINVPQNSLKLYNKFNSLLDDYNTYLQEVNLAVSSEKSKSTDGKLNDETLTLLYSASKDKFLTLDNDYTSFSKNYIEFKENNTK